MAFVFDDQQPDVNNPSSRFVFDDESGPNTKLFTNDRAKSGGMQSVLGIASPSDRAARAVADDVSNVITTAPATVAAGTVRGAGSLQVAVAQAKAPGFMLGMGYVDGTGKSIPVDDTGEIFTPPDRSYFTKRNTGMERSGFDKMDQADMVMAQIKKDAPVQTPVVDKYLREGFFQAGNMLPTLPLAAIPVVGPEVAVQMMAQGAGADAVKKGRELGLTDEEIDDYKSKTVTPEYVGERLSIAPMLAMLNNKVPFFKALGTSTLAEVGSELGTSHFQLAADKAYEKPGLSKEERNSIYDSWLNMDAQRKDPAAMAEWVGNMKDTAITTLGMTHVMGAAGGVHRVAAKIGEVATAPSRGMDRSSSVEVNDVEAAPIKTAVSGTPVTLSPYQNEAYDDTEDMPAPKGPLETAANLTTTEPVSDNIPSFIPPATPVTTEPVPSDVQGGMAPPSVAPVREVTEADQVDFENAELWENNLRQQGRLAVPDIEGEAARDQAWRLLETYRKAITPMVAGDSAASDVQYDSEPVADAKGGVTSGATDILPGLQNQGAGQVDGQRVAVSSLQKEVSGVGSDNIQSGGLNDLSSVQQETGMAQEVSPVRRSDVAAIDEAAHAAATSPYNSIPEPTQAQIEAGNYKKGHITLHGLDIAIENPAGSVRKGVDETGKAWQTELAHHYGYIKGTIGNDKDHVDVFVGPNHDSGKVFVVDQINPKTGVLDEHKVMMGFDSVVAARSGYLANYDKGGAKRIGAITETSATDFKQWLKECDTSKRFATEWADNEESPSASVADIESLIASGKSNATMIPAVRNSAGVDSVKSIANYETALLSAGWEKQADKRWTKGTGSLFLRSQGELSAPIVQWTAKASNEPAKIIPAEQADKSAKFAQTRLRALESKLKKAQGSEMKKKAKAALDAHKTTMKANEPEPIKVTTIRAAKPVATLNPQRDHLLTAIAKLGGLDLANAASLWGAMARDAASHKPTNMKLWGRPLFRKTGGLNVDSMAELLAEHGYLQRDENHKHDLVDFEEKLSNALAGKTVVSGQNHQEIAQEVPEFSDEDLNELSLDDSVVEFIADEYADLFEELSEEDYNAVIAYHEAINREAVRLIKEMENADSESATVVRQDKQVSASEETTVPERAGPAVIEGYKPSETPEAGKRAGAASPVETQDKLFATPPTFGTKPQPKTTNSDVSTSDLLDNFTSVESVQPDLLKVMPKEQTFSPAVMPSLDDFDKLVTELTAKPVTPDQAEKLEAKRKDFPKNKTDYGVEGRKAHFAMLDTYELYDVDKPNPSDVRDFNNLFNKHYEAGWAGWQQPAVEYDHLQNLADSIYQAGLVDGAPSPAKKAVKKPSPSKAQSAKTHAGNAYTAGLDAIKAILDNASNPDKLNSGIGIDDEVYQQIKPHLIKMWFEAKAAGSDAMQALREFIQRVINDLGEKIVPYSRTFYQEVLNGDIIEATNKGEETDVNVERSSADLERDSQDSGTANRVGKETLSDGSDGTDGSIRSGSDTIADAKFVTGRDPVLPRREAATPGEFGNPPIQSNQHQAESADSTAGSEFDQRSGDFDVTRTSPEPVAAAAVDKAATRVHELKARLEAQKTAQRVKVVPGDLGNIEQTLPLLLTGQSDDVKFAEDRFALPTGYGAMFTNGTGTGKTFSGLGIIKRLERQGKKNVLIVTPQANVLNAWVKSGKHFLLDITSLKDTQDAGTGIVVTTYANFGQNAALAKRQWDAVVFDEAHYLNSNQTGDATNAQTVMRAITLHPDGAWQRADMLNGELKAKTAEASAAFNEAYKKKAPQAELDRLKAPLDALNRQMDEARKQVRAEVTAAQGTDKRSRVLFLSATPFAYDKNIEYANGYLFDYGPPVESGGYNSGGAKERFFMQHFGYRMRYNKLTEPEAEVDQGLMQRQFNSWLKQNKALSGRMLAVDQDYDRKFVLLDSAIGRTIDEGLQFLQDDHAQYGPLYSYISKKFDYLHRRYLLEAIKAKEIIPILKQHLALNRKVVVFHDYNQGGGMNPFDVRAITSSKELVTVGTYPNQKSIELGSIAARFVSERPDLVKLPFASYGSALSTLHDAFPDALLVNGTVSKKDNLKAEELFQDHKSGRNLIIVQADKGKEGISLHDTVGDMPRVLFNLGLPVKPTQAIQQEGRIFRTGQASNAMFRYLNTGTNWERWAFATTIARRASTAENLAMGEDARMLLDAFVEAYQDSDVYAPGHEGEGTGGIARDRAANAALTEWDRALTYYFSQQKKTSRNKAQEGIDYFPTPEPLALKMVEWADIMPGESALEPSAGHGAIARFLPANTKRRAIEPSTELTSRLGLIFDGDIVQGRFEDHHVVNKYDAIVMNPPFGSASKTAFEHIEKAAQHLKDKGRIVALIPGGPASDKRLEKLLYEEKVVPVDPVGQRFGKDVYAGDTVTINNPNGYGKITGKITRGVPNGSQPTFWVDFGRGQTAIQAHHILELEPTGKREKKSMSDLTLVADIQLPRVTFERAGTSVSGHIIVLDKNRTDDGSSTRRRDYTAAETINDLFERVRDAELPERQRNSQPYESGPVTPSAVDTETGVIAANLTPVVAGLKLAEFPHTKTGAILYVAAIPERLPAEQYAAVNTLAKKHGGSYSRYNSPPAVPGFLFKNSGARQAFVTELTDAGILATDKVMEIGEVYGTLDVNEVSYEITAIHNTGSGSGHSATDSNSATRMDRNLAGTGSVREQLGLFTPATTATTKDATAVTLQEPQFHGKVVRVVSGVLHSPLTKIKTIKDAARVAQPIANRAQEGLIVIVVDNAGKILGVVQHSTGSANQSIVHPRDLSGVILDFPDAAGVYLAHNHPSGDPAPSAADYEITKRVAVVLKAAGIDVKASIQLGFYGNYQAFNPLDKYESEEDSSDTTEPRTKKIPIYDRNIVSLAVNEPRLTTATQFADARERLFPGQTGVLLVDGKNRSVGFIHMTVGQMLRISTGTKDSGAGRIMHRMHETGAVTLMLSIDDVYTDRGAVENMVSFGNVLGVQVLDAIPFSGSSMQERGMLPNGGEVFYQNPMLNPALIVSSLSGLAKNLKEDIPKLVKLGQVVIRDGASTYQLFLAGMKQYLGDKWSSFKGVMLKVYHYAKEAYRNSPLGNEIGAVGEDLSGYKYQGRESSVPIVDVDHKTLIPAYFAQVTPLIEGKGFVVKSLINSYGEAELQIYDKKGIYLLKANRTFYKEWVSLGEIQGKIVDENSGGMSSDGAATALYAAESKFFFDHAFMLKTQLVHGATVHLFNKYYAPADKTANINDKITLVLPEDRYVVIYNNANRSQMSDAHEEAKARVKEADNEQTDYTDEQLDGILYGEAQTLRHAKRGTVSTLARAQADKSKPDGTVREEARQNRGSYRLADSPTLGLKATEAQAWVKTLPIAKHVNVVQSVEDLPMNARSEITKAQVNPARVQAMELHGTIHVITDNVPDLRRVKALVIGHELAHAGQSEKIVDLAVDWFNRTKEGKTEQARSAHTMLQRIADSYGYDLENDKHFRRAVQEATAAIAEQVADGTLKPVGLMQRLFMYIKHWLRQNGLISHVSDSELSLAVAEMLRIGEKRLSVGKGGEEAMFAAAWHGSPHDHNGFSTEYIGEGEGAQAYGWGMYFAGSKSVAEYYKNMLSARTGPQYFKNGVQLSQMDIRREYFKTDSIVDGYGGKDKVLDFQETDDGWGWRVKVQAVNVDGNPKAGERPRWHSTDPDSVKVEKVLRADGIETRPSGKLYHVELAPADDEYLLWDRPLSEQSDLVIHALSSVAEAEGRTFEDISDKTGEELYKDMEEAEDSDQAASEYLHSFGIRGIKYINGVNRISFDQIEKSISNSLAFWQQAVKAGNTEQAERWLERYEENKRKREEAHNYVIFNDADVEITAKFALSEKEQQQTILKISEAGTLGNLKNILNPFDYSRFRTAAAEHLPHNATTWLADNLGNPFWMKENNPAAVPFYEEAKDREVTRMDNNIRMFGGLVDKEGKRVGWEKAKGLFDWTDKTTAWGKIRQEQYNVLTDKQKNAYDVIRFEGDAYNKTYATLADALRNQRIKAAGMDAQTFRFYQAAMAEEAKAFDMKLAIAQENMAEAGMTPEDIEGHISEYRARYKDIEGWVHRDHGEGEYQVRVYQTVDRLDFDVDKVQHKGEETDRIRLGTFPGAELSQQMEKIIERRGGSFKQLRNGAIVILTPKGQGQKILDEFNSIPLVDKEGDYKYKVLAYSRFVSSVAQAKKLTANVKGNYAAAMPRNFREGYSYETSWSFSAKLNEDDYQVLKTSDMKLELILRNAIDKAKAKSEISEADATGVQDALVQSVAEILLGRGAGLYQIRRAQYLIEGYDTDNAIKKYEDYINGTAGLFSKARYALRQFKNMKSAAPKIRAWATKYVGDSLRNMGTADKVSGNIRAIVSLWYLGFNTSWMLVNSTQPYVLGQAELSRYTTSPLLKIAKAEKDILTGKLSTAELALLEDIQVRSQDHDSVMAEMTGSLEGVTGAASQTLHNVTQVAMALGQKVEVLNRHTMIIAGYRVFKDQGMDHATALTKALDVNSMVNIDMGRYNLPGWARGPIGRTFYALQSYIQHMLNYLWNRSSSGNRNDQKAILRLLFAMFLIGGLPAGAPGSDELDKLIQKMFGYSPKLALKSWSRKMAKDYDTPGEMLEGFVWHGVPGAFKPFGIGVSLTGATQLRLPIISSAIGGDDMFKAIGGPVAGLFTKGKMSLSAALRGDWGRATEYLLPTAIANPLSAIRQATDGVKTASGKRVEYKGKQLKMEPHEAAIRAFGLQPVRTADISETRGFEKSLTSKWNDRRKEALNSYRITDNREEIYKYNKAWRANPQVKGLVDRIELKEQHDISRSKGKTGWQMRNGAE